MRITSKGQVTIPLAIRQKAGLLPDTEVEFELDGDAVRIRRLRVDKKSQTKKPGRGERLIARMRKHPGDVRMTTDEILALTRGE
jgi:AbrB family looped-hinge helix DNA binding protein